MNDRGVAVATATSAGMSGLIVMTSSENGKRSGLLMSKLSSQFGCVPPPAVIGYPSPLRWRLAVAQTGKSGHHDVIMLVNRVDVGYWLAKPV